MNPLEVHKHVAQSSGRELGDVSPLAAELVAITVRAKVAPEVPLSVASTEESMAHRELQQREKELKTLNGYVDTVRQDAEGVDLSSHNSKIRMDEAFLMLVDLYDGEKYVLQAEAAIDRIPLVWNDSQPQVAHAFLELYKLTGQDDYVVRAEAAFKDVKESENIMRFGVEYAAATGELVYLWRARDMLENDLAHVSVYQAEKIIPPVALGLARSGHREEAYGYISRMRVGAERAQALVSLASISGNADYLEEARELVGQLELGADGQEKIYEKIRMRTAVAAGLKDPNYTAEVLDSAMGYADGENKYLLIEIAEVIARQGDVDGALAIIAGAADSRETYDYALAPIVAVIAERGDIAEAISYAEGMQDGVDKLKTFAAIYRVVRSRLQELES